MAIIINEARTAPIYHGTDAKSMYLILTTDTMKANQSNETETVGVSFTRNQREAYDQIYVKVDQEKLNYNYKIHPVYRDGIAGKDLAEERVDRTIHNFSKYILEIGLNDKSHVRVIRNKLSNNFGNKDVLFSDYYINSRGQKVPSLKYLWLLITMCHSKKIKMNRELVEAEKYITMFMHNEHDVEYETKIANRKNRRIK